MLNKFSIRSIMSTLFLVNIILLVLSVLAIFSLYESAKANNVLSDNRLASIKAADEFRQGSDDLTRLARTYAITGDAKYEKMYFDVLDIRNGKKPRPEKYDQIYWDLVLDYGDKPKPDGKHVVLKDYMKELGFSDKEFKLLAQADKNSNGLVQLEVEAMNAVKGLFKDEHGQYTKQGKPDLAYAAQLLHSNEYHAYKADIMRPVEQFLDELDSRTKQAVIDKREDAISEWVAIVLICALFVSSILSRFIVNHYVVKRLIAMRDSIQDMERSNDLTLTLPESSDEIGHIGSAINALSKKLREGIEQFIDASGHVLDTASQVSLFVEKTQEDGKEQNSQLTMIAAAMEQMVSTLKHVAENVNKASNDTSSSEESATAGRASIDRTHRVFEQLDESFQQSANIIKQLTLESSNMSNVLDVIKSISEQTNLLALNAAIEAARAGEQGRGFAVVADEVRTLAQRSQESAGEIEAMLTQLQNKAQDATRSIEKNAEEMHNTRENISEVSNILSTIAAAATDINQLNVGISSATQEQLAVSEEINQNVNNLNQFSNNFISELNEFLEVSRSLQSVAANTKGVTDKFQVS